MTLKKNGQIASWTHKYSWIIKDMDGSLAAAYGLGPNGKGYRNSCIVPRSGVMDRNPWCHRMPAERSLWGAHVCEEETMVRRVAIKVGAGTKDTFYSHYAMGGGDYSTVPKLTVTDVTDIDFRSQTEWYKGVPVSQKDKTRLVTGVVTHKPWWHKHPLSLPYGVVPRGVLSCLEQAPKGQYSFIVATGRKYLIAFYDRYDIFVSGLFDVSMFKMLPTEHVIFTMGLKGPFT